MKRSLILALLLVAPRVSARKPIDFLPSRVVAPVAHPRLAPEEQGKVEQVGEVVVLEGDTDIVGDDGAGGYFIDESQIHAITERFYGKYPDEYSEIVAMTSFEDAGQPGALAYYLPIRNQVRGIGYGIFDDAPSYGATRGELHGFVNMMRWDQYRDGDGIDQTDPRSFFYPVLGQEFAHRWLSFLRYRDASGQISTRMLGRDEAHWGSTLQADASVLDGNRLVDNGDGSFTVAESNERFSALDLYAMGLVGADQVPPWFLVQDATRTTNGASINPAWPLRVGTAMRGTREEIAIADVIAAEGERVPSAAEAPHAFRVVFVLITRPGEKLDDVLEAAATIDRMRRTWEEIFTRYTGGTGTMCTQVSAPCGAATARVAAGEIVEQGGNGNGVVEPGEPVAVRFTIENDGPVVARPVAVTAVTAVASQVSLDAPAPATVDRIDPGQKVEVSWSGAVLKEAECGRPLSVTATAVVEGHTFHGRARVVPGETRYARDDFEGGEAGFAANADRADTATQNGWQYGTPVTYLGRNGWSFQPGTGHSGARCWFTGLQEGHRPMTDSSVGVGKTALYSRDYDLSQAYKPELRYWGWFQAIDFSQPSQGGTVIDGRSLEVAASTDGGRSWVEVDRMEGSEAIWRQRQVPLADKLGGAKTLRLRFVAENLRATDLVEAGVDDVEIQGLTRTCDPSAPQEPMPGAGEGGCGCAVTGRTIPSAPLGLVLLTLLVVPLFRASLRRTPSLRRKARGSSGSGRRASVVGDDRRYSR